MNKTEKETRKPRRKRWLWIVPAVILCPIAAGVFMCSYTPRAYQPSPTENPDQISTYLTHELGPDFFNNVQLDEPFELLVKQHGLNDIVAGQFQGEQFDGFSFIDPMIVFGEETIYLMGTLNYKQISSVITLIAIPEMTADNKVCMNIQSVRMGVLPVTKLVTFLAQQAFDQSADCFEGEEDIRLMTEAIIRNEPFDPVFEADGHTARITEFTLTPGLLTLTFQPEP
ncbi:MAG: hypothetical protein ACYSUT_04845 [Planctomycetota bacterium]|jgi:hypothetical protein